MGSSSAPWAIRCQRPLSGADPNSHWCDVITMTRICGTRLPEVVLCEARLGARSPRTDAVSSPRFALRERICGLSGTPAAARRPSRLAVRLVTCGPTTIREKEAVLFRREKLHNAAITAALVVSDDSGAIQFVTAALDKTLVFWSTTECGSVSECQDRSQVVPCSAPVFSMAQDTERCSEKGKQSPLIYCGTANRSLIMWEALAGTSAKKLPCTEHTGWVRALAAEGRWLFSCTCNTLHQWDLMWATPRHVRSAQLFSGDILGIAVGGGMVYTCGADGSIHSWKIDRKGNLCEANSRCNAHEGRISGIVLHRNVLYTVGYDGCLKAWYPSNLEPILEVKAAHSGERVHCIAVGPDSVLYTGGDDKLIQRWVPGALRPLSPLYGHANSVRVLSAGRNSALVSGDAAGNVMLWSI